MLCFVNITLGISKFSINSDVLSEISIGKKTFFANSQLIAAMTQLLLSARASPHPEIGTHYCRFGWGGEYPVHTSGGGFTVSHEGDDGLAVRSWR